MQVSDSDHDWVILNLNMTGYYRVSYDKLGWKKLNQQLEKDPKVRIFLYFLLSIINIVLFSLVELSFHKPVWWEETLPYCHPLPQGILECCFFFFF